MNSSELSRRALAVVAKLTIFAGAAGCAGTVEVDSEETPTPAAPSDPGDAKPATPDPIAVNPPEPETKCSEAKDPAPCCNTLLEKAFSDGTLQNDPTKATSEQKACCELVVGTMDKWDWAGEPPFNPSLSNDCCFSGLVEGSWDVHPSCTPWGPPMPIAMPRHFLRNEVLA